MKRSSLFIGLVIVVTIVAFAISGDQTFADADNPKAERGPSASSKDLSEDSDPITLPEFFQLSYPISTRFAISYTSSLVDNDPRPRYLDVNSIIDHKPPFYQSSNELVPYTGEHGDTTLSGGSACEYLDPSNRDYCYNGHSGLDIPVLLETNVYAAHAGYVVRAGPDGGAYGTWVVLQDIQNPQFYTLYGHLTKNSVVVSVDQFVARGELLGLSGTSGASSGAHLHFGLYLNQYIDSVGYVLDPYGWFSLKANEIGATVTDYKWAKGAASNPATPIPNDPQSFDFNEGTAQGHEFVNKQLQSNGVYRTGDPGVDSIEHWWADNLGAAGPPGGLPYYRPHENKCQDFEGGTYCEDEGYTPFRYSDVPINYWAHRYVQWATREGIVGGYSDGTFRPTNFVTRAQFSKMILNTFLFTSYTPQQPTFCDVPTSLGDLYTSVETLEHEGIITGYEPGSDLCVAACGNDTQRCFLPGEAVRRGQMTKFVAESARKKWGLRIETETDGLDYWDVPTNDAFYTYIRTLHNIGAIRYRRADGYPGCTYGTDCQDMGHFYWGWAATRGQAMQLIHETIYAMYCPTGDPRCPFPQQSDN
ncbi:MAG TPA: peptidoglycan DD-metalloendopeptidase family protein [Chloroflexia bacterium]|nr:peptidoglycan DD-metalloendopeptidase family protein [Chloroflexia bacterium]